MSELRVITVTAAGKLSMKLRKGVNTTWGLQCVNTEQMGKKKGLPDG